MVTTADPAERRPQRERSRRQQVLQVLGQSRDGLDIPELAAELGLHANTVRFHLEPLVAEGLVERRTAAPTGPGRPRSTYLLQDAAALGGSRDYRMLAGLLAGFVAETVPDAAAAATGMGREWGRYQATRPAPFRTTGQQEALEELVRIMDEVGFRPELTEGSADTEETEEIEVTLRHCPFREVAEEHPDVVCAMHLGLIQGALEEMRAPVEVVGLEPFVAPSACRARLTSGH